MHMHKCKDEDATEIFASAILREVPLARLDEYLAAMSAGDLGPLSLGEACGNGCGSGCGNNCIRPIDQLGHTALTLEQLSTIVKDRYALCNALGDKISDVARAVC